MTSSLAPLNNRLPLKLFMAFLLSGCASSSHQIDFHQRGPAGEALDPELIFNSLMGPKDFARACFPNQTGSVTIQVYEYKETLDPDLEKPVRLRAYVFTPPGVASGSTVPTMAMFNGGAWRGGNPTAWFPQGLYFASRGMVTIAFQYREELIHGRPSAGHPNIAERATNDARSALFWIRKNAAALHADLDHVVVAGDSAGGHLALITSLVESVPGEPPAKVGLPLLPKAILALYPVVDAENLNNGDGNPVLNFADVSPMRQLSPAHLLPNTKLILGAADRMPWTSPAKTVAFCERENEIVAGVASPGSSAASSPASSHLHTCETDVIPEPPRFVSLFGSRPVYDHAFMVHPMQYKRMMTSADAFLTSLGLLHGDPAQSIGRVESASSTCISTKENIDEWAHAFGYSEHAGLW